MKFPLHLFIVGIGIGFALSQAARAEDRTKITGQELAQLLKAQRASKDWETVSITLMNSGSRRGTREMMAKLLASVENAPVECVALLEHPHAHISDWPSMSICARFNSGEMRLFEVLIYVDDPKNPTCEIELRLGENFYWGMCNDANVFDTVHQIMAENDGAQLGPPTYGAPVKLTGTIFREYDMAFVDSDLPPMRDEKEVARAVEEARRRHPADLDKPHDPIPHSILRLVEPISLDARWSYPGEKNITEIDLGGSKYIKDADLEKTRFVVFGEFSHAETVHHLRPIIMRVKTVRPEK